MVQTQFSGPVVERELSVFPGEWSGPVVERLITVLTPQFPSGPVVERLFLLPPPPTPTGPVVERSLALRPQANSGPVVERLFEPFSAAPLPYVPPVATACEPTPIITPAVGHKAVNFGDPEPVEPPDSLNKITSEQFKFIARRNTGTVRAPILGRFTGPAYPFGGTWASTFGPKPDLNVVFTNVVNILTTPLGTLPYAPESGSPVPLLVFELNDATTHGLIKRFVQDNLRDQEPRARVLFVRTVIPEDDPHKIVVTVAFQIVGDPSQRVYTAPIQFNTLSLAI